MDMVDVRANTASIILNLAAHFPEVEVAKINQEYRDEIARRLAEGQSYYEVYTAIEWRLGSGEGGE